MNCGHCGHQPPAGSTFCNGCGAKLVTTCASCGATPPPGSRFCNACGAPLAGQVSSSTFQVPRSQDETRTLENRNEEPERAPVYCAWEDLHWADPSTLELLGLPLKQTPTARLFVLLTSRPEFTPPWGQHGHFSQLTLSRLGRQQVPQMIAQATRGQPLPAAVVQQIVAKTDGVPLFVEELTKTVLKSIAAFRPLLREQVQPSFTEIELETITNERADAQDEINA